MLRAIPDWPAGSTAALTNNFSTSSAMFGLPLPPATDSVPYQAWNDPSTGFEAMAHKSNAWSAFGHTSLSAPTIDNLLPALLICHFLSLAATERLQTQPHCLVPAFRAQTPHMHRQRRARFFQLQAMQPAESSLLHLLTPAATQTETSNLPVLRHMLPVVS